MAEPSGFFDSGATMEPDAVASLLMWYAMSQFVVAFLNLSTAKS